LRVLDSSLGDGVMILGRTVRAPAFGRGNLDDVRLSELKRMQNASTSLGNGLFEVTLRAALGESVAAQLLGTNMDEVRRSRLEQVERCYRELFRPETSALIAVGDITLAELLPLAEHELGTWQAELPRPASPGQPPPRHLSNRPRVHFIPQLSNGQSHVVLLQPAPASRAVRDELPFLLLAEIAAGAVSSRANLSLRHEAGITYGVEPRILSGPDLGLLMIEASFETSETVRAVADLQRMLQELRDAPVSEAELSLAKVALLAELERRSHDNQALAHYLASAFAEGRSATWLAALPGAIAAVTASDIQRVARSYLRPRQLEIGIAGPATQAAELEILGELELYRVGRSNSAAPEH
jgi:zinc protease